MERNPGRAALATALLAALLAAPIAHAAPACRAVDGDSLVCGAERVRLYDVYAAELDERGGRSAKHRLQRLLAKGEVKLVRRGEDRYGRTLADLYIDGRLVVQDDIGPRAGRGLRSEIATRVFRAGRPAPQTGSATHPDRRP